MKYILIFWVGKKWLELSIEEVGMSINVAHQKLEHYSVPNIQQGMYLHWQVVEEHTDLTTLPPPP